MTAPKETVLRVTAKYWLRVMKLALRETWELVVGQKLKSLVAAIAISVVSLFLQRELFGGGAVLSEVIRLLLTVVAATVIVGLCVLVWTFMTIPPMLEPRGQRGGALETADSVTRKVEGQRPRVRIKYVPSSSAYLLMGPPIQTVGHQQESTLVVKNTGDIEAKRVRIEPIRFNGTGRRIVFRPVDVLGTKDSDCSKQVECVFYDSTLKQVTGAKFETFFVQAYFAETESIELPDADSPATAQSGKAIARIVAAGFGIDQGTIELRATYCDDHNQRYLAKYRLSFSIRDTRLTKVTVELRSDGEPTAVGRQKVTDVVS